MINLSVQQVLSLWAHGTVLRNLTGNGAVAGRGQAGREEGGLPLAHAWGRRGELPAGGGGWRGYGCALWGPGEAAP